jgi:non-heme chloroperoxidase
VPPIRANLAARKFDSDNALRALEVPLLVTQGRADIAVLPAMAEHVLATCPTAEASWYEGVGHMPVGCTNSIVTPRLRIRGAGRRGGRAA